MCVIKIDAALIFIVEGRWTSAVALVLLLLLLEGVHRVTLFALALRRSDFNFTLVYLVSQTFFAGCSRLIIWIRRLFGFFSIRVVLWSWCLSVFGAKVYEFFTKVDLGLVWIFIEFLKLLLSPLSLLFFSLFIALVLSRLPLIVLFLALFSHLLASVIALLALSVVFRLAFLFLRDHHLSLADPFNVFD